MSIIQWSPEMTVGVRRLDQDHQTLIDLINRIATADDSDLSRSRIVPEALTTLIAYTVFHFRREEAVMRACGYPEFATHQEDHRLLAHEVNKLATQYTIATEGVSRKELQEFLVQWLSHHILLQDKAYLPYCAGSPVADAAADQHGEFDIRSLLQPQRNVG